MTGKIFRAVILAVWFLAGSIYPVSAAQAVVDEVNLAGPQAYPILYQQPSEINVGLNDHFIVSDYGLGLIWNINPVTAQYNLNDFGMGGLTDAHQGPNGAYWFTDNQDTVYYADVSHAVYYGWTPAFSEINIQLAAMAVTSQNTVWLADYYGVVNGLYRLTNTNGTADFCTFEPALGNGPYDTNTIDLIFKDGFLWAFNFQLKQILRLNTVPQGDLYTLEVWQTPIPEIAFATLEGWVLDFDDQGNLWVGGDFQSIPTGSENYFGIIYKFNPVTKVFSAYSVPIENTATMGVTLLNGKVWFANLSGLIGEMDPLAATPYYSEEIAEADHETLGLNANCTSVATTESLDPPLTQQGTLSFTDQSYPVDSSHTGWTLYQVPDAYTHWGINNAQNFVVVSGRNQTGSVPYLVRFSPPAGQYSVFLPLIRR